MSPIDPGSFGSGFDAMFTIIPIIMVIGFVVVIGGIIFSVGKYAKNKSAPQESVHARVVAKRMDVRHHTNHHNHLHDHDHHHGSMHTTNSSRTYYYITLEFDNGVRQEYLDVKNLYGLVVEGDTGYALTQGEWIVAFERNPGL